MEQNRANQMIEELTNCGVLYYVISPGLRCTPFSFGIYSTQEAQIVIHFDERGCGFMALGIAKAIQKPVCLLCTCGSAMTHYYPAIVEASLSHVPLIILGVDRPCEVRNKGANQSMDQVKIFGSHVRFEEDIALTDPHIPDLYFKKISCLAYRYARDLTGPVFLNCVIRNPLEEGCSIQQSPSRGEPSTLYYPFSKNIDTKVVKSIARIFSQTHRGIVLVGEIPPSQSSSILDLAQKLQWPILSDPLSGLRSSMQHPSLIPYFPFILKTQSIVEKPQLIVLLGNRFVSENEIFPWLKSMQSIPMYHISQFADTFDPTLQVTHRCEMPVDAFCTEILSLLTEQKKENMWLQKWQKTADTIKESLFSFFSKNKSPLSEMHIGHYLSQHFDLCFFFANSLSIRIAGKMFFSPSCTNNFFGNRGISGIDGSVATAIGLATGLGQPLCAMIGDQAFLHDINSLSLAKNVKSSLIFLLLNNHGAGLFYYRPDKRPQKFVRNFVLNQQQEIIIQKIAEAFHIPYIMPKTISELVDAFVEGIQINQTTIIELQMETTDSCYKTEKALMHNIFQCMHAEALTTMENSSFVTKSSRYQ